MAKVAPIAQGQICEVTVTDLGTKGEGIGKIEKMTAFVPGALPGEKILCQVTEVKKTYMVGKIREIITPSKDRREPACPKFDECGGCQLQHLDYMAQLTHKERQVKESLRRIGGIAAPNVLPIKAAPNPWHYRNKMQFPVGAGKNGAVIGCYAVGSHRVVDTDVCLIQQEGNNDVIRAMRQIIAKYRLPIYNENKHNGLLRHIVGRVGSNDELMVVLVTAQDNLPQRENIVAELRRLLPNLVSLHQNTQSAKNNVVMGQTTKLLWGKPAIETRLGELTFTQSPRSFFQVNTAQTAVLYDTVKQFAALNGRETVLDAYCGTGTIGLYLAKQARKIIGVEIVPEAIADAQKNARQNGIDNAEFLTGDTAKILPQLYATGVNPDAVILDPPRSGTASEVLHCLATTKPSRLVYVSCNPATLARDAAILRSLGYEPEKAQPVDMFPQTTSIETVVLFVK